MEIQITQPIIEENFFSSGKPTWQRARINVECIDVSNGYKYIQKTSPYGSNWQLISKYNVVPIVASADDDSFLLMGG